MNSCMFPTQPPPLTHTSLENRVEKTRQKQSGVSNVEAGPLVCKFEKPLGHDKHVHWIRMNPHQCVVDDGKESKAKDPAMN